MEKFTKLGGVESRKTTVGGVEVGKLIRRACEGVAGGRTPGDLERLEGRQLLTATIHYTFDNDPEFTALDSALEDIAQDATHDALTVAGRFGGGVQLENGTTLRVSEMLDWRVGDTASVAFWIKTTQVGSDNPRSAPGVIAASETGALEDINWGFIDGAGRIGLFVSSAGLPATGRDTVKSTRPINNGQWHHVAMTRDRFSGRIEIYVDGFLNDSAVAMADVKQNFINEIGVNRAQGALHFLNAALDEFLIDNDVLGGADVARQFDPSQSAPAAPTLLSLASGASGVEVKWQGNAANASGYIVERSTDGVNFVEAGRAAAGATRFVDSGLSPTTTYHYRVRAFNPTSPEGVASGVQSVATKAVAPAGNGTGLLGVYYDDGGVRLGSNQAVVDPNSNFKGRIAVHPNEVVNFNWGNGTPDPVIGPDRFSVRWTGKLIPQYTEMYTFYTLSDDGASLWVDGNQVINDPTYHAATANDEKSSEALFPGGVLLEAGREYDIRMEMFEGEIGAVAQLRWASLSTPKQIIPATQLKPQAFAAAPTTPTGMKATASGSNTINLEWSDVSNEIGYRIYRSTTGAAGSFSLLTAVGNNRYSDRVYPGQTYYYQVASFNTAGDSARSANASATTQAAVVEPGLIGTYYPNRTLSDPAAGTRTDSAIDKNYGNGQPTNPGYYGNGSPGMPGIGADNFSVRWEGTVRPDTSGTYTFFPRSDDGMRLWVNGELMTDVWTTRATLEDTSRPIQLQAGQSYPIVVEFFEATGVAVAELRWSATNAAGAEIVAKDYVPTHLLSTAVSAPAAPTALTGTTTATTARLTWTDAAKNEHSNLVEISTDNGQTWASLTRLIAVSNVNGAAGTGTYTVTGLQPGKSYRFRVRAVNVNGESFSNVITATTAAAANGVVTVTPTSGDQNLSTEGSLDWSHWGHDDNPTRRNARATYVAFEAEDAVLLNPDNDQDGWRVIDTTSTPVANGPGTAASGARALLADVANGDLATNNGVARYQVYFPTAGTYQLYTRRRLHDLDAGGTGGNNNSIYVPSAMNISSSNFNNSDMPIGDRWDQGAGNASNFQDFSWFTDARRTYTVTQPGPVNFHLGTREGGYVLDRIVLSQGAALTDAQLDALANTDSVRGGGPISDVTLVGAGAVLQQAHTPGTTFSWSHAGQPDRNATATDDGIAVTGSGNGVRFTVPAGTSARRLKVYVGVENTTAQLTATLSDGSMLPIVQTLSDDTGPEGVRTAVFTIDVRADTDNQTMTVEWLNQGSGQAILQAATLIDMVLPGVPTEVVATGLSETSVQVTWKDNSGNETGHRVERTTDGTTWVTVGTALPNAQSFRDIGAAPGTSYQYRVVATGTAGDTPSAAANITTAASVLPSPWQSRDVGTGTNPVVVGDATLDEASGTWTITSGGSDIWDPSDHFHFVYQPMSGDGSIVARVADVSNTDGWAKAGVMIRENLTPGSKHAYMMVTPSNRARFHGRVNSGGASFGLPAPAGSVNATGWVKLERVGSVFNAFWSADGQTWVSAGTQAITMGTEVLVGLAATAHSGAQTNTSVFDNVTVAGSVPTGQDLTITGSGGDDTFYLKRVGENVEVFDNTTGSGAPVHSVVYAGLRKLVIDALDGNDRVILDLSGGDVVTAGGVTVNGGNGNDVVRFVNPSGDIGFGDAVSGAGLNSVAHGGIEAQELEVPAAVGQLTLSGSASVKVVDGNATLTVGGVTLSATSHLDLGTNDLKVVGGSAAALHPLLRTARNGAVRWQGPGIGTSAATPLTGLAAVQQGADALVKYTYNGDANGDGRVNADDYFRIDQGFLSQPANPTYGQGNFNLDGTVNADDYFLIDQAFLGQGTPLAAGSSASVAVAEESAATRSVSEAPSLFSSRRIEKRGVRRGR